MNGGSHPPPPAADQKSQKRPSSTRVLPPPAGGWCGRRPIRAPAPKTDDVSTSARGPPSALRGRAPAASLREGDRRSVRFWPLWHRGSRRRASAATKLQDNGFFGSLKQSRAAELGRAADPPRVPRDQNGRGSMYSHQDHKTPASGSTRGYGSQSHKSATVASHGRSSFPRGYPLPRRSLERYAALGLSQGWCSLGHSPHHSFTVYRVGPPAA